jgi:tripartite-type tricarboxylate transporter receptor subunit TctC
MTTAQITKRTVWIYVLFIMVFAAQCVGVAAQQAGRAITIVVPYTPGTGVDMLARLIGEEIQRRWGQPVVIDNKPGASGAIGSQLVARAPPDGHTLLIHTDPTFTAHASLVKNLPYDPINSFAPVINVAAGTLALVTHASLPVRSTQEFIAYARERPGKIDYGTPGLGTPHHLTMEAFRLLANIDVMHVPFRDSAGLLSNLLGGHVGATFMPVNFALPLPKEKARILAVTSAQRISAAPELPTIAEQGFPGFEAGISFGILGPARVPTDIVSRYNNIINDILRSPHVVETLRKQGMVTVGGSAESFARKIAHDLARWRKVVAESGMALQ